MLIYADFVRAGSLGNVRHAVLYNKNVVAAVFAFKADFCVGIKGIARGFFAVYNNGSLFARCFI